MINRKNMNVWSKDNSDVMLPVGFGSPDLAVTSTCTWLAATDAGSWCD